MKEFFTTAVVGFEAVAAGFLIVGAILVLGCFIIRNVQGTDNKGAYRDFRADFGSSLLLALDLLVAANVILTVALELTFTSLKMLGLLVLIRTFVHLALELEFTAHWPWQRSPN